MPPDPQPLSDDEATYELDRAAWNLPSPRTPGRPDSSFRENLPADDVLDRAGPAREAAEMT